MALKPAIVLSWFTLRTSSIGSALAFEGVIATVLAQGFSQMRLDNNEIQDAYQMQPSASVNSFFTSSE